MEPCTDVNLNLKKLLNLRNYLKHLKYEFNIAISKVHVSDSRQLVCAMQHQSTSPALSGCLKNQITLCSYC